MSYLEFFLPVNFPLMINLGAGLAISLVDIQRMTTKPAPTGRANQWKIYTKTLFDDNEITLPQN